MEISTKHFSFTLTIPAFKNVIHNGRKIQYGQLSQISQYNLLEDVMRSIRKSSYDILYVYEEHADKRLHIHGMFFNEIYECARDFILDFYRDYRICIKSHKKIFGDETNGRIADLQQTLVNKLFFIRYMEKHQDTIKFFPRREQEEKECAQLDGKKYSFKVKITMNEKFFSNIEENINSEFLPDEYPFGKKIKSIDEKKKNKFLIEF